jgi:hypothetical protein
MHGRTTIKKDACVFSADCVAVKCGLLTNIGRGRGM